MSHQNTKPEKKNLTKEQYSICFLGNTEAPFSGKYYKHKEDGVYCCVSCGNHLFDSTAKYDSGSGWPSFFDVVSQEVVKMIDDFSHHMHRIEVKCHHCDAHLGHVFNDGPAPTGQRWCINSLALDFIPRRELRSHDK